jgi:chromosome segregation ATPase
MPDWFLNWITPSGVMLMIGGITWGVQLNIHAMLMVKRIGRHESRIDGHDAVLREITTELAKVSIILQQVERDVMRAADHIEEHNSEAESWKRRIVTVEERIKSMGNHP